MPKKDITANGLKIDYAYFQKTFTDPCINKAKNSIRFVDSLSVNGRSARVAYKYFELDANGVITNCDRGYGKYKGMTVTDLDKFPPMIIFGREI
jgi:hypothetical protein